MEQFLLITSMMLLFKATSEGGLYFGRLEEKAKTLNGQLDLVANNFNDLFANLGEQGSGVFQVNPQGVERNFVRGQQGCFSSK